MEGQPAKKKRKLNETKYLQNRFILFYTLRQLWKINKRHPGDLYRVLFPSKSESGGNKTLYDNILKLHDVNLLQHSERLAELTGLSEQYFTGECPLKVGDISGSEWERFIQLRKSENRNTKKSDGLSLAEFEIKRKIKLASENSNAQHEQFKRLWYFAQYGHKRIDKTLIELFEEIESKIDKCRPEDFERVDLELLENHQKKISDHLHHIAAVVTLRNWKKDVRGSSR